MNTVSKTIASVAAFAVLASFVAADQQSKDPVELPARQVEGVGSMPSLTKHSVPLVSSKLIGTQVTLRFTISKKGKPTGVDTQKPLPGIYYPRDRDFAVQMIEAVKHWRFEPARGVNGEAKAIVVLMPVEVVKRNERAVVSASFQPLAVN